MTDNRRVIHKYINKLSDEEIGFVAEDLFKKECDEVCPIANYCLEIVQGENIKRKRLVEIGTCHGVWTEWLKTNRSDEGKIMKANSIPQKAISKTHCDIIADSAKEIKALLGYDDNTIALNYTRLKTDIECIKNSVSELEISYIK